MYIPMLISVSDFLTDVLFCHVLAPFVLVLQVGVKNIPNHNNHVPLGQLRDHTASYNYHECPIYLYRRFTFARIHMS